MKNTKRAGALLPLLILSIQTLFFGCLLFCGTEAHAQNAPVLTITPMASNQFSITITNGTNSGNYEIWWTPVLGDTTTYPWTGAAVGATGQTNFILTGVYPTIFFRATLDMNAVPLWQAADPNNPSMGILAVTIDSPTNSSSLQ